MDPFAKALQASSKARNQIKTNNLSPEIENNLSSQTQISSDKLNPFSEALARTGGASFDSNNQGNSFSNFDSKLDEEKKKKDLEKQRQKEALKLKLHKEINPVDLHELYSAERKKTQKKLDETRKMIQMEMLSLRKEVKGLTTEITLFQEVTDQGMEGTGFREYLDRIRQFIRILKKQVHSTRTWLHTQNAKSAKKRRAKNGRGIEISGQKFDQTKAVFDQMHHEQSTVYSGN